MSLARDRQAWLNLFPNEDFRFHIGVKQGRPENFFAPTADHAHLIAERKHWITAAPEACAVWLPEAAPLLEETFDLARQWQTLDDGALAEISRAASPQEKMLALGRAWEPDFLLLAPDEAGEFRLVAGIVCFPSSWRVTEKIGRGLEFIHGPVPTLNPTLGPAVRQFLTRLRPGVAWLRSNWGMSRSPELNYHPDRHLPRLTPPLASGDVWIRIENQALVALPSSKGILFGIRLEIHPLAELKQDATAANGLRRALQTMPEEIAVYKGLSAVRAELIRLLEINQQPLAKAEVAGEG